MSKGGGQVQETPQQVAMAKHAKQLMDDYQARWQPLQMKLAGQIQEAGKEGSAARKMATGQAATDAAIQFNEAQGGLEKSLTNAGAGPASSKFKLGLTGMGADAAQSTSKSQLIADQQITDAYTRGLGAVAALGRGERMMAGQGMENAAAISGQQAANDAAISLQQRAGTAGLLAQGVGYGLEQGLPALKNLITGQGTPAASPIYSPSKNGWGEEAPT
jgi:hypothetical protein